MRRDHTVIHPWETLPATCISPPVGRQDADRRPIPLRAEVDPADEHLVLLRRPRRAVQRHGRPHRFGRQSIADAFHPLIEPQPPIRTGRKQALLLGE